MTLTVLGLLFKGFARYGRIGYVWQPQHAHAASLLTTFFQPATNDMTNKGLAFSLGGVKKAQAVKPRPGLNKPFKANALSVFETQEDEGMSKDEVQQKKRQRLESAGCCAFPVMLLLPS